MELGCNNCVKSRRATCNHPNRIAFSRTPLARIVLRSPNAARHPHDAGRMQYALANQVAMFASHTTSILQLNRGITAMALPDARIEELSDFLELRGDYNQLLREVHNAAPRSLFAPRADVCSQCHGPILFSSFRTCEHEQCGALVHAICSGVPDDIPFMCHDHNAQPQAHLQHAIGMQTGQALFDAVMAASHTLI